MNGIATIKDISQALGISISTVSRALRNTFDVSQETRMKVLKKAKELDYKPNLNAINLVSGKTKTIGVIIPLITNYYFSTVLTGIQSVAYSRGYNIILFISNDSREKEIEILKNLPIEILDGLIISSCSNFDSLSYLQRIKDRYHKKIVFFDRGVDRLKVSKVFQEDYYGAVMAVEHLIQSGYTKIAHITGPENLDLTRKRKSGYVDTLKRNKIKINKDWIIHSGFSEENGIMDTSELLKLKNKPDAIFAVNDRKAVGSITFLKQKEISIGSEFGVIGFTNTPFSQSVTPSLSTVSEPALEIGLKSAEILLNHLMKKEIPPTRVILPCELIVRESTRRA